MRLTAVLAVIYILLILIFPQKAAQATIDALSLWARAVVPSLLPCYCGALLLLYSGALPYLGKKLDGPARLLMRCPGCALAAVLLSYVSGFPTGARVIGELHSCGALDDAQARRAITWASCCSPGYILGAAASLLGGHGPIMLAAHLCGAVICGVIAGIGAQPPSKGDPPAYEKLPLPQAISASLSQGGTAMVGIGAAMAFFMVLLKTALFDAIPAAFLLELSNGCAAISALSLPAWLKCALICACTSFGGICVYFQSEPYMRDYISPRQYLTRKLMHAGISFVICCALYFTFG